LFLKTHKNHLLYFLEMFIKTAVLTLEIHMADDDKRQSRHLMSKIVVTKSGKRFGEVGNLTFEVRTGELIQIVLKNPTGYAESLDLERSPTNELLIPFSSVIAVGDFVVVAEEDIL